jgi:hypothetical protein
MIDVTPGESNKDFESHRARLQQIMLPGLIT